MTNTVQMWLMSNSSKFGQKELSAITPALDSVDEASTQRLMTFAPKSPVVGILLTLFLGQLGIGRFYAGNGIRGSICLILWGIGYCGLFMSMAGQRDGALLAGALGPALWMTLLDLFSIFGEIKRDNAKRLCEVLGVSADAKLKKQMREHIIVYWILWVLLGGCSVVGMNVVSESITQKERNRQEAIRRCEQFERQAEETARKLGEIERKLISE